MWQKILSSSFTGVIQLVLSQQFVIVHNFAVLNLKNLIENKLKLAIQASCAQQSI